MANISVSFLQSGLDLYFPPFHLSRWEKCKIENKHPPHSEYVEKMSDPEREHDKIIQHSAKASSYAIRKMKIKFVIVVKCTSQLFLLEIT